MEVEQKGTIICLEKKDQKPYFALVSGGLHYDAYGHEDLSGQEVVARIWVYEAPLLFPLAESWIYIHGYVSKILLKI
ncbi:MAG: hypothetical protein RM368_37200 [Nostoc sp. DedSLP03]|uniref:hypothetical protein n=1 Tax=Nostoc sp. DedSLP03 TaxID=3075400 RepID=UPI002AD5488A|nr:hypothetical protein [Nostoc sp. DedSLP03]MDZ7970504.1 hypothetical protein [Nostoc sp. DedSLP03]